MNSLLSSLHEPYDIHPQIIIKKCFSNFLYKRILDWHSRMGRQLQQRHGNLPPPASPPGRQSQTWAAHSAGWMRQCYQLAHDQLNAGADEENKKISIHEMISKKEKFPWKVFTLFFSFSLFFFLSSIICVFLSLFWGTPF